MFETLWKSLVEFFTVNKIDIAGKEEGLKAQLQKQIDDAKGDPIDLSKLDLSKLNNNDGTKQLVETLINNNKALETKLNDTFEKIGKMMTNEEARQKAIEDDAKAQLQTKVTSAVEGLIKSGKFAESKKEFLTKLAQSDYESFENLTKDMKTDKHFADDKSNGDSNNNNQNNNTNNDGAKVSPLKSLTEAIKSQMGDGNNG